MNVITSVFHKLDKEKLERLEKIILSENVRHTIETVNLYCSNQRVTMHIYVTLTGIDKTTNFKTEFYGSAKTFQELMDEFLVWWDREIIRFNSFNQLTKEKVDN